MSAQLATASLSLGGLERANSPQDESAAAALRRNWSRTISKAAENLSKAVEWGRVLAIDSNGEDWIADAHRDDGKRFVVRADELLTALAELESAIRACGK